MTREALEKLVDKCLDCPPGKDGKLYDWSKCSEMIVPDDIRKRLVDAIEAVITEEREACAQLAENKPLRQIAAAIRARSENKGAA